MGGNAFNTIFNTPFDVDDYVYTFTKKDMKEEDWQIIINLFKEAKKDRNKIYEHLVLYDEYGISTYKEIRNKIKSCIQPSLLSWIYNSLKTLHINKNYIDIEDAKERGALNLYSYPLLYFAKNRWSIIDGKVRLKLGEKFLFKYGRYTIDLPLDVRDDIDINKGFKISLFWDDILDEPYIKCYYNSEQRDYLKRVKKFLESDGVC